MAYESQEELTRKIESLAERIEDTKGRENYNEGELARMELELKRLKNLKGDEGVHRAADVKIPDNLTMTTPDVLQADTNDEGDVVNAEGEKLGKKGVKASEEKKGAD